MSAVEPVQSGPYPTPTDAPDGPSQMAAIATWAAGRLWMRFASTAARDAAIAAPVEGMHCTTGTGATQQDWAYRGGTWRDITVPHTFSTYVPTLSGVTLGNGTLVGEYTRHPDGLVLAGGRLTLGSTSSVTGTINIGLPVAASSVWNNIYPVFGRSMMQDISAGVLVFHDLTVASATSLLLRASNGTAAGPTTPFTWASGDILSWNVTYRGV